MSSNSTLLCIHRNPADLGLLQENGYKLLTATNGHEGLRLFMSQPVDAIVLEYHLGLLDGATIADEIRRVRPQIPIVMLVDHLELPDAALKSVDALVTKTDGAHFLWATVHFVLSVKPASQPKKKPRTLASTKQSTTRSGDPRCSPQSAVNMENTDQNGTPLSLRMWKAIRSGNIRF